jgi:hypothetical protein
VSRKPDLDPTAARLREQLEAEQQACERWWRRLARAFRALEKHRRRGDRLVRRLARQGEDAEDGIDLSQPLP